VATGHGIGVRRNSCCGALPAQCMREALLASTKTRSGSPAVFSPHDRASPRRRAPCAVRLLAARVPEAPGSSGSLRAKCASVRRTTPTTPSRRRIRQSAASEVAGEIQRACPRLPVQFPGHLTRNRRQRASSLPGASRARSGSIDAALTAAHIGSISCARRVAPTKSGRPSPDKHRRGDPGRGCCVCGAGWVEWRGARPDRDPPTHPRSSVLTTDTSWSSRRHRTYVVVVRIAQASRW
jgi:hypothetical protein